MGPPLVVVRPQWASQGGGGSDAGLCSMIHAPVRASITTSAEVAGDGQTRVGAPGAGMGPQPTLANDPPKVSAQTTVESPTIDDPVPSSPKVVNRPDRNEIPGPPIEFCNAICNASAWEITPGGRLIEVVGEGGGVVVTTAGGVTHAVSRTTMIHPSRRTIGSSPESALPYQAFRRPSPGS